LKKIPPHRFALLLLGALTLVMGIMIFIYPPSVYPDAARGFGVMNSMQKGGSFNMLTSPNPDDISKNVSQFMTWWSPGQYLVPYFFKSIFGLNTGQASAVAITLLELSGLLGFYYFFKKTGFTPVISTLTITFIACQQAFITPYIFYNGGEVLLFGFEGWFLYGCISLQKTDIKLLLFVLLSGWLGFLCKSSFIWMYAAGMLCLWLRLSAVNYRINIQRAFKNGIWLAIPAIISLVCIYVFFLSKGDNPTGASSGLKFNWQTFTFPLGSPLISGFSIDELTHGLLFPTFTPMLTPAHAILAIVLLALISLILIGCIVRYVSKNDYRLFLLVFYLVSIFFFSWVYTHQLDVSYEGRHFRVVGILMAPGLIYLISKLKPALKMGFIVLCTVIAFTNYSFFVTAYAFNKNISARGTSGLAQQFIDQPSLNYLMNLDKQNKDAIFVFVSPDLPLEITNNRTIIIDPPLPGTVIDYEDYIYGGHAGPLYLLLPAKNNPDSAMFMKFFPDYKNFSAKKLGSGFTLYSAK